MPDLVSIIIPCFNAASWVADAIESALRQTHKAIEVVVVDDGSTDDSLSIIRSFGDRVRWDSGANRGACAARNRGLEISEGDYIQFLDADDLLHPEKVERQLGVIRYSPDSLVYSFHEVVSLDPDVPAQQWNRRDCAEDPVAFMFRGDLPTPAPLHHRSTIGRVGGFREDLPCAHDRDFHFRMALCNVRFIPLPDVLFTIRRRSGSIGTTNEQRLHEQRGAIAMEVYEELVSAGQLNDCRALACAAMLTRCARRLYELNSELAREFATRAKSIHPSGGEGLAYSRAALALKKFVGPVRTEQLISLKRSTWKSLTVG